MANKLFNGANFPILGNGNLHISTQVQWAAVYTYMVEKNLFRQAFSRAPERGDTFGSFHFQDIRSLSSYLQRFTLQPLGGNPTVTPGRILAYNIVETSRGDDEEAQINSQYWAKRGSDTGQGGAFIGSQVRKPNGSPSKLFSGVPNSGDLRFDTWTVKDSQGKDLTFQLFTDVVYKELRDALIDYTNLWNKQLGNGRRFREGNWTESDEFTPPATVDQSTAATREADARAAAEKKSRPEISEIEKRQLKQLNIPSILISQTPTIAQATGITTGQRKLENISLYKGSPESLIGLLAAQGTDVLPFIEATPDQLGGLSPHIELFFSQRHSDGSETDEPVFFSDHVNPEHLLQVHKARRTDDLSKLTSTKGSNVGIRSFEWTYDNKHFGDNVLIANLSIYFASMADLVQPQWHELLGLTGDVVSRNTSPSDKKSSTKLVTAEGLSEELNRIKRDVKHRETILSKSKSPFSRNTMDAEAKNKGRKSKKGIGKEYRDLKIIVGWSTPERTYGRVDDNFITAIKATRKLIKLNLMKFQIEFGQEGQATLNMEFAGSIGNFLSDDEKSDVLGITEITTHFDTLAVDLPVLLPGDKLLGLPETTFPNGYLSKMMELHPKIQIDTYKKLGTAGSLGSLGGQTVEVNRAGIMYELETLRQKKRLILQASPKDSTAGRSKPASAALKRMNTYIETANAALESINSLFQKAKYASFLERMLKNKKIYYSTIGIVQARTGPEVRFSARGSLPLASQTQTAKNNLQASWSNSEGSSTGPREETTDNADIQGGFIDPDASIFSDVSVEEPGQINAYYLKLGDIIDTAFSTASERNDCGVILGSFSPSALGIGNAASPRYYSLADIPISLEAYGNWFNTHITNRGLTRISFRRFIVSLLDDLVAPLVNNLLSQATKRTSMSFEITIAQSESTLRKGTLYSEQQMRTKLSGIIPAANRKINQYMVITCNQVSGDLRGNLTDDAKRGIQHLVLGSDRGLVKNFSFSEKQVPHLRAMNIANAQWNDALVLPQDAELTMVGNNLFQNGQMVYINADLGLGKTVARRLGIGGYYRIVRSSHAISAGSYETVITCHWEMPPA